jgi:tellurite resistance protein TerC
MTVAIWGWTIAVAVIVACVAVDFRISQSPNALTARSALYWTGIWIVVPLIFAIVIFALGGGTPGVQFISGYLLEKALSIDNVFVFALIFSSLGLPNAQQPRALSLGIAGALILRAGFIAAGGTLVEHVSWITYIFGGFLILTGARMLRHGRNHQQELSPLIRRVMNRFGTDREQSGAFFTRIDGRRSATPTFAALVAIAIADVVFAADSIPAIFGITTNLFIVFTSNAFAVLGLRPMYSLLATAIARFTYVGLGLAVLLVLFGTKMVLEFAVELPVWASLVGIAVVLGSSVFASVVAGPTSAERP